MDDHKLPKKLRRPLDTFFSGIDAVFALAEAPDMARVPDEELARIKSQVIVEELCCDYGIELRRTGPDNLMGRYPIHEDHEPS